MRSLHEASTELPGFSVTAPWAFNWFLDGNENKVDISIMGTNGKFFLINAHGVLRRMGAVTEIPGSTESYVVKSKASPHLTSPQLTSPTSGYKWSQVLTSGFTWLKVVLCG